MLTLTNLTHTVMNLENISEYFDVTGNEDDGTTKVTVHKAGRSMDITDLCVFANIFQDIDWEEIRRSNRYL